MATVEEEPSKGSDFLTYCLSQRWQMVHFSAYTGCFRNHSLPPVAAVDLKTQLRMGGVSPLRKVTLSLQMLSNSVGSLKFIPKVRPYLLFAL